MGAMSAEVFSAAAAMEIVAERWWDRHFSAFGERIPFKSLFFPLLLQVCDSDTQQQQQQNEQLSQDELAAIVKHCVAENAWRHGFVTKQDFLYFVARFGPLELTISKVVSCFCVNGELVPWFHGLLGRAEADRVLANHKTNSIPNNHSPPASPASGSGSGSGDGTFLIRFSESHPTKFTLSYVKIHTAPPYRGRREMKNCLIENLGLSQQPGGGGGSYVLTDSKTRGYSSILSFVQRSAGKLKHGVPSVVANHCNSELAEIRALQDQQSNSYTAFSAETFDMTENASLGSAANRLLLFSPSSPSLSPSAVKQFQVGRGDGGSTTGSSDCCADSYSGFTLDALTAPPLLPINRTNLVPLPATKLNQQSQAPQNDDDYGEVGQFFNEAQAKETNQQSHNAPPMLFVKTPSTLAMDENADYGNFMSLAASGKLSSPVAATRIGARLLSPSSSRFPQQQQMGVMQLSPSRLRQLQQQQGRSSSPTGVASLVQKKQQSQEDAYGTFESFASTYAAQSQELAQRSRATISFSRMNMASSSSFSSCASTVSSGSSMGCDDPYGSFASVSVTKPAASSTSVFITANSLSDTSEETGYGSADYGNFASLGDVGVESLPQQQQQVGDEFLLGPPPPPRTSQFQLKTQASDAGDVYGSFATLLNSSENHSQEDNNDDLYGQFQFETKVRQTTILAQAHASQEEDQQEKARQQPNEEKPAHSHSDACSALEELNAGMACYREKQLDAALIRFIHAREVARATEDKVVEARALGNLGTVYLDQKNPQQAVVCYQRCLDITRSIKDTKRERTILNNLVLALMASEAYERALVCCQVQLEMTTNEINRRKIFSRMSLLREKAARASRERTGA